METALQLSEFVRIINCQGHENCLVYHSLFGYPLILNPEALIILKFFRIPQTPKQIKNLCDEDPSELIDIFESSKFIVPIETSERESLKEKLEILIHETQSGKTIDRMGLAISDACNFGCRHCLHFKPAYEDHKPKLPKFMTWEIARKSIDLFVAHVKKHGKNKAMLHFGNAEPLLNWKLIHKILEYCDTIENFKFEFAINTNLALLTHDIAVILKKFKVKIATSLDGTQKANDAIRITAKGKKTFELIISKFKLLADIGYPLDGFSITVTDKNFDLIDTDIIDLAISFGMKSIAFDYDLINTIKIPVSKLVAKLMKLKKYADKHGIDFFGTWDTPFRNLTASNSDVEDYGFCAAISGKSLEIKTDGSIGVCNHSSNVIGHIDSFEEIFDINNPLIALIKERFPGQDNSCFNCEIEGLCAGQCQVTRETTGKEKKAIFETLCDFYKQVTIALMREEIISADIEGG